MFYTHRTIRHLFAVLFVVLSTGVNAVFSQDNQDMARQFVEMADEIMRQTQAANDAREMYVTAANFDPENVRANYMAGMTTLESINKANATSYFLKVYRTDPEYRFDLLFKIGLGYHYGYSFDEAISYYTQYLDRVKEFPDYNQVDYVDPQIVERRIYECEIGKKLVEFPEPVEIINAGPEVNSSYDEYGPVMDADETVMIFTTRRQQGNMNEDVAEDNFPFEDMFISRKEGEKWSQAENIGSTINTLYHESSLGLSKDGNTLFIYTDENEGDIYSTQLQADDTWTELEPVDHINTDFSETSMTMSADGTTMFFASNRPDGHGGFDIWATHKNDRGRWQRPYNLGPEINSIYDEDSPFIGHDSKTLYFSSRGGEGMGGFDIFRIEYDSASQAWGTPANMGYPINTPDDDIYFTATKGGERAYYGSVRDDSYGFMDIYVLNIPDEFVHEDPNAIAQPPPEPKEMAAVTLNLIVTDEQGQTVDAVVAVRRHDGGGLPSKRTEEGIYEFQYFKNKREFFIITASKDGYISKVLEVEVPAATENPQSMSKEIQLAKGVVGIPLVEPPQRDGRRDGLRNVYFDFNISKLRPDAMEVIDKIIAMMNENSAYTLNLRGHSDTIGLEKYNNTLSINRANNVLKYIIDGGVDPDRIEVIGLGSKYPLASNDQEREGRELNRRVEFEINR